ncbi:uncharacterized protein [Dysidea avara]
MGVFRFLRLTVRLSIANLPEKIPIDSVGQLISDANSKRQMESFLEEIDKDNQGFTKCFSTDIFVNEGILKDVFRLYDGCEEVAHYVYCYADYQRCCHSKWQYWRQVFLANENLCGTPLIFTPCDLDQQHNCDLCLKPYFYDNGTLEEYLNNSTDSHFTSEIKQMLYLAKSNNNKEGMFAYRKDFNESCEDWSENIWSKRLAACIEKYIVNRQYRIKYTGDQGNRMYNEQLLHHRFHGAPDLTIYQSGDDARGVAVAATLEGSVDDSNESSQETTVGPVEDSIKVEGKYKDRCLNMTILEKCGELLANMHIVLVDKMLKAKRLHDVHLETIKVDGILLSRPSGIVICKYVMPVIWFGESSITRNSELTLESKITPILPENICVSMRRLLDNKQ